MKSAADCVVETAMGGSGICVATRDEGLKWRLSKVVGVMVILCIGEGKTKLVVGEPSLRSVVAVRKREGEERGANVEERMLAKRDREKNKGERGLGKVGVEKVVIGKRKRAKEPNPLSVKKKKKGKGKNMNGKGEETRGKEESRAKGEVEESRKKRRRRRRKTQSEATVETAGN